MTISKLEQRGRVALLTLDNPPVNALSQALRADLIERLSQVGDDPSVEALVIACAGRTFIAGADIREFDRPPSEPHLPAVVDAIDAFPKPVVAAIHGAALGGGLEIALACHYRIATPEAKLGLPEAKLGLMPGARGTQHLPRLVGAETALRMIAFGTAVDARQALGIGLVDRLADNDLVAEALAFAETIIGRPVVRIRDRTVPPTDPMLFERFVADNARKLRGLAAPPAIVKAVRAAVEAPYDEGAALERQLFLELRAGPQSRALRHLFQAERSAAKLPELDGVKPRDIDRVGVIGAGTMGSGIAVTFLLAGLPVTLIEQDAVALDRGVASIRRTIEANVAGGRTSREQADGALARLDASLDYGALRQADLVIEAAFETMAVKEAIFARLDAVAKPGAILATNTSYLDVDAIAAAGKRPADTLGLHFFSPANVMKLLEIVRGRETAPDVLASALAIARRIGKTAVVAGNAYGFIGNRMLAVRRREAERMVVEGASPYVVDKVLEAFGFPMGPFKIGDLAGLDLGWSPETSTGATLRERLCEAGRRGQKTGRGFYDYDDRRRPSPSAEAEAIIARFAADTNVARRAFSDADILARLLWPMIDEGARLLAEGVARCASDIDVVWVHGYGWPAWTGGPMYHAGTVGFSAIAEELRRMDYAPSDALLGMAGEAAGSD